MPTLPAAYRKTLDNIVEQLPQLLGDNLYSCIVYGSAVRGNVVAGYSDINLLIILNQSTPQAHAAIADCINGDVKVDLFIIGRRGMERSFQTFAIKFRSIKRNYKLLCGVDPLQELTVSDERLRFICEQALRNLRLRCVHNFIFLRDQPKRYTHFLFKNYAAVFTDISEVLRLEQVEFPKDFADRIPHIESFFDVNAAILTRLLELKAKPEALSKKDIMPVHSSLFQLLNTIVIWVEEKWPQQQ